MADRRIEQAFALIQEASAEMYKTPVNTLCECSILAARRLLSEYIAAGTPASAMRAQSVPADVARDAV